MTDGMSPLRRSILEEIRRKVANEGEFNTWFGNLAFALDPEGRVAVQLPNIYWTDYYERRYRALIEVAVAQATGEPRSVCFVHEDSAAGPAMDLPPASPSPPSAPAAGPAGATMRLDGDGEARAQAAASPRGSAEVPRPPLNPRYVFENFVVGPSNRLAHAAALATVENPARSYNPLFLHGSVGLGKTHLLQAICHAFLDRSPGARIQYLSCEEFVNNYISAVKRGGLESFRQGVRTLDVLLIDDIHFLADREGSQEEFFHTFNTLHNAQKQIILSSDSPPKSIPTLADRLVSRFRWGMVARIDTPTFEMRVAILRRKAELHDFAVGEDILNYIAHNIDSNIREIEGAILKLMAHHRLNPGPITLEVARDVLRDAIDVPTSRVTVSEIQDVVTRYFSIKLADLQSKRRSKAISLPRQVAIYLCRKLTGHSLEEIGAFFGGKDHTTILYAVDKIQEKMDADEQFRAMVTLLLNDARQRRVS